jgi:hypothetical protein
MGSFLFQYAAVFSACLQRGVKASTCASVSCDDLFIRPNIRQLVQAAQIPIVACAGGSDYYVNESNVIDSTLLFEQPFGTTVHGLMRSMDYFSNYTEALRSLLQFPADYRSKAIAAVRSTAIKELPGTKMNVDGNGGGDGDGDGNTCGRNITVSRPSVTAVGISYCDRDSKSAVEAYRNMTNKEVGETDYLRYIYESVLNHVHNSLVRANRAEAIVVFFPCDKVSYDFLYMILTGNDKVAASMVFHNTDNINRDLSTRDPLPAIYPYWADEILSLIGLSECDVITISSHLTSVWSAILASNKAKTFAPEMLQGLLAGSVPWTYF